MSDAPKNPRQRAARRERLIELGGYWLGHESGRATIYCYHFDASAEIKGRRGKVRRESTGERDVEKAKVWLAKKVLLEVPKEPSTDAATVAIASVRAYYWEHHARHIRSAALARRSLDLIAQFLNEQQDIKGAPTVADFGLARQEQYMRWAAANGQSAKSISTYLTYYAAAVKFAAKPRMIPDGKGGVRSAQLLTIAPYVGAGEKDVTRVTGKPAAKPRDFVPPEAELARVIDHIREPHVRRYVIMALNTWARPEAIIELRVTSQVDFERGMVHMNQPGRAQNNKVRPTIRLTENLRAWLMYWNVDAPICRWTRDGRCHLIKHVSNRTLQAAAASAGVPNPERYNRYVFRHFMATRSRSVPGIEVKREQRAEWLGHMDPRNRTTQGWYESMDADYLLEPKLATDAILERLAGLCRTPLVAPTTVIGNRFRVVENGDKETGT